MKLGKFQRDFIRGAYGEGVEVAVLSIGRGNAKSALEAAIGLDDP